MPKSIVQSRFPYTQATPTNVWTIQHNLNLVGPVVEVWTIGGTNGIYTISEDYALDYTSASTVVVTFASGALFAGIALVT